jgi:peroxiredoxin/protocatechuate 3,4-dioxygenase beta subunit
VVGKFIPSPGYDRPVYFGEGLRALDTLRPERPKPENYDRMNKRERQQWYNQWSKTTEAGAYYDAMWHDPGRRHYVFHIKKDGSFRIEDVIAGRYKLTVWIEERLTGQGRPEEIASYYGTIEVSEMQGGRSDEPLDLGEFELTMHNPLHVGDLAPLFEAKTLDGKDLKLIDYRGKFVLLSFWQPVFHPEKQQLQELYDTYGSDGQLEIIGLGGNDTLEEVKNYVKENAIPWPQIFTGEEFKSGIAKDYDIPGIPWIFFVGPDGRIVAKNLRDEKLMSTVIEILNAANQNKTDRQIEAEETIDTIAPPIGPICRYSLSFDGIDDYLHVEADPKLTLKPPFTIQMWIKPDRSMLQHKMELIQRQKNSDEKVLHCLNLMHKGKMETTYDQEGGIKQTKLIGGFLMFAQPYLRPDLKCYGSLYLGNENGQLYQVDLSDGDLLQPARPGWIHVSMNCTRETYIPVHDQPLIIGGTSFKGDIAEIRIWSGVRSGDQVARYRNKPLTGTESGLVACWDFKRAGGQIVYDISPNGNHARLGSSESPDEADPKWIDLQAPSPQSNQKTNMQDEVGSILSEATGRVVDENGQGVSGATLKFYKYKRDGTEKQSQKKVTTMTDKTGRFHIPVIRTGEHLSVWISALGFAKREAVYVYPATDGPYSDSTYSTDNLIFKLKRLGIIEGQVIGPNGKSLVWAPLSLSTTVRYPNHGASTSNHFRAITDEQGHFRMEDVPPGTHLLYYPWSGPSKGEVSSGRWRAFHGPDERRPSAPVKGVCAAKVIKLGDGELRGIVIDLSKSTCAVEGQVHDTHGRVVADAMVSLYWVHSIGWESVNTPVATDAQGRYRLQNLPPGDWHIRTWHDKVKQQSEPVPVELKQGRTIQQDLALSGQIELDALRTDVQGGLKKEMNTACRTSAELMDSFLELARNGDPAAGRLFAENIAPDVTRFLEWWGGTIRCREMVAEYQQMRTELLAGLTEERKQFYKKVRIWSDRGDEVTQVGARAYGRLIKSNRSEKSWIRTLLMREGENGAWQIVGFFNHNKIGGGLHAIGDYLNPWSPAIHPDWGDTTEYNISADDIARGCYIDFDDRTLHRMTPGSNLTREMCVRLGIDGKCGSHEDADGGGLIGIDLLAHSGHFIWGFMTPLNVQLASSLWQSFGSGVGGSFVIKTREGGIGVMSVSGDANNYSIKFKMLNPAYLDSTGNILKAVQVDSREAAAYFLTGGCCRHGELDVSSFTQRPELVAKVKRHCRAFGRVRLDTVHVINNVALAVTSKSSEDKYRRFVLFLSRDNNRWLVTDVQLETKDDEGEALRDFLKEYPDARIVPNTMRVKHTADVSPEQT